MCPALQLAELSLIIPSLSDRGRLDLCFVEDDLVVEYFVQHRKSDGPTTLLERRPLESVKHGCNAGSIVVSIYHKASCSSLNRFQLIYVFVRGGVPNCAGVLQNGADVAFVCCLFQVDGADLQIAPQEAQSLIGFGTDVINVLVP